MAISDSVYQALTGDYEERVCRDIPESACAEQPGNFLRHVLSLAATKTGDGLADPKLVLSWLFGALGAPAYLIGFLVPVREAGALLPQLAIAAWIRARPQRKWVWAAGSLVQGLSVAGMAATAFFLDGAVAGWTVVGLLATFSIARSACSVSHKDVLGKTVSKSTRGTATGTAATIAAILVLAYGVGLSVGLIEKSVAVIAAFLLVAAGLWIAAAAIFATLAEEPGATEGGGNPLTVAGRNLALLRDDAQLRCFIATRALLIPTALAPPFLLALAGETGGKTLGALGPFVVASGLASVASTYVWGRLSDISSRKVLALAGIVATIVLAATALLGWTLPGLVADGWLAPALLFALMIAYQGVRLGRSTHIVDMASRGNRAAYTALSNTIIGAILVAGGAFGLVAEVYGYEAVLAVFAGMTLLAAFVALGLDEVQARD